MRELLDEAEPDAERGPGGRAVGRRLDRGTPTAVLRDGRDALLAVGMNGEPLPVEHGFPVRMVVPGPVRLRLGLQVGDRAGADHASPTSTRTGCRAAGRAQGPIKTQSRIDTPRRRNRLTAGPVTVAGRGLGPASGDRQGRGTRRRGPVAGGDARADRPRWTPGCSGPGGGRPRRASTPSRCGPPTRTARRRPNAAGGRPGRRDRLAHGQGHRALTPARGSLPGGIRGLLGGWAGWLRRRCGSAG